MVKLISSSCKEHVDGRVKKEVAWKETKKVKLIVLVNTTKHTRVKMPIYVYLVRSGHPIVKIKQKSSKYFLSISTVGKRNTPHSLIIFYK